MTKIVKLSKDVHLREVKRPLIRVFLQPPLGALEAALVLLIEGLAILHLLHHLVSLLLPHVLVAIVCDVGTTGGDHLIGHFHQECSHPF